MRMQQQDCLSPSAGSTTSTSPEGGGKKRLSPVQAAIAKFNAQAAAAAIPTSPPLTMPSPPRALQQQKRSILRKSRYQRSNDSGSSNHTPKTRTWSHDTLSTVASSPVLDDDELSIELLPLDQDFEIIELLPLDQDFEIEECPPSPFVKTSSSSSSSKPLIQLILPGSDHKAPLNDSFRSMDHTFLDHDHQHHQEQEDEQDEINWHHNTSITFKEEVEGCLFEPLPEDSAADLFYTDEDIASFRHEAFLELCGLDEDSDGIYD